MNHGCILGVQRELKTTKPPAGLAAEGFLMRFRVVPRTGLEPVTPTFSVKRLSIRECLCLFVSVRFPHYNAFFEINKIFSVRHCSRLFVLWGVFWVYDTRAMFGGAA